MSQDKPSIKIFTLYHKPYPVLKSKIIIPLHVGRADTENPFKDRKALDESDREWMKKTMAGDDTGDNISYKNRNYCELTGIYWAWKNYDKIGDPDYIGFMHYRRHFIFNEEVFNSYIPKNDDERAYSKYTVGSIFPGYEKYFGLTDKIITEYCKKYDCIMPKKAELKYIGAKSIKEDYKSLIGGLKIKDYKTLVSTIKKAAPEYYKIIKKRMLKTDKNCFHSFILKKELFFEYCSFLFKILDEAEKKIDVSKYSINGQRTIGYLGELLFDCYMDKIREENLVKYKELGLTHLCIDKIPSSIKNKTAIVLLACYDYESLEIALTSYCKYLSMDTKLYILQNGRGTYDCERTYRVAQRFENLYPNNIKVIDSIEPQKPYFAIRELINSKELEKYEYICKVDEDSFPITHDWLDKLCESYERNYYVYGNNLAYVSPLINNNPFGFKQIIENSRNLKEEYFKKIARDHKAGVNSGPKEYKAEYILQKNEIDGGECGTIWRYSHIARWLHEKTTLFPDNFIKMTSSLEDIEIGNIRFSINCILFAKYFWNDICSYYDSLLSDDDEHLSYLYCKKSGKKTIMCQSIPFVHLFFLKHREENRDLLLKIRVLYQKRINPSFPISMMINKEYELEDRLRYIEEKINKISQKNKIKIPLKNIIKKLIPHGSKRYKLIRKIDIQIKLIKYKIKQKNI